MVQDRFWRRPTFGSHGRIDELGELVGDRRFADGHFNVVGATVVICPVCHPFVSRGRIPEIVYHAVLLLVTLSSYPDEQKASILTLFVFL